MKVFLSSTAQDLVAYRRVADDTILRMSQEVVAMERFGPLPGEPAAECERKARECDLVVCIVAHRYGFVPDKGRGSITRREVEVLEILAEGATNRQISKRLFLSEKTVKAHLASAFRRLGVQNRTQAAMAAAAMGIAGLSAGRGERGAGYEPAPAYAENLPIPP